MHCLLWIKENIIVRQPSWVNAMLILSAKHLRNHVRLTSVIGVAKVSMLCFARHHMTNSMIGWRPTSSHTVTRPTITIMIFVSRVLRMQRSSWEQVPHQQPHPEPLLPQLHYLESHSCSISLPLSSPSSIGSNEDREQQDLCFALHTNQVRTYIGVKSTYLRPDVRSTIVCMMCMYLTAPRKKQRLFTVHLFTLNTEWNVNYWMCT